jgi:hypothetical protein
MHRTFVCGITIAAVLGFSLPANSEMVRINTPTIRVNPPRVATPGISGTAVGRTSALTTNSTGQNTAQKGADSLGRVKTNFPWLGKHTAPANTHELTQAGLSFQKITTSNNGSKAASKDDWAGNSTGGSTTGAGKAGVSKGGPTTARCRGC